MHAAMFMSTLDTEKGPRDFGPFSRSLEYESSIVCVPPIPEPMMTPALFPSKVKVSKPASLIAIVDEAMAKWMNLSILSTDFSSIHSSGLKFFTSAAIWERKSDGSKWVTFDIPFRPAFNPSQNSSSPTPIGVTAPNPVTTTRCSFITVILLKSAELL